jgi:hypothetical protein
MKVIARVSLLVMLAVLGFNPNGAKAQDPNCQKDCGTGSAVGEFVRECVTTNTCYVTYCGSPLQSNPCSGGYPYINDNCYHFGCYF